MTPDGGMVRIGNAEFWSARANAPAQRIAVGSQVRVVYVSGLTAYVEPVPVRAEVPSAPGAPVGGEMAREER